MEFFKKTWVTIVAFVFIIIGLVMLFLGGFTEVEIKPIFEQICAILGLISILIIAIKKLLQKKDTAS